MRPRAGFVVTSLAILSLAAAGPGAGGADDGVRSTVVALDATTGEPLAVNATNAEVLGTVAVGGGEADVTAWMEYRGRPGDGDWARTQPRTATVERADGDPLTLGWYLSGLEPATTYEYRVVARTANGTDTGAVRTFTTLAADPTPTHTPTSSPCAQYSGGTSSLCTRTPTDPPADGDTETPFVEYDDVVSPSPPAAPGDWLAGLLPLLGWVAAVTTVAPLVLGGLLVFAPSRGDGGS